MVFPVGRERTLQRMTFGQHEPSTNPARTLTPNNFHGTCWLGGEAPHPSREPQAPLKAISFLPGVQTPALSMSPSTREVPLGRSPSPSSCRACANTSGPAQVGLSFPLNPAAH